MKIPNQTPDTTTLSIGNNKPFFIRSDKIARLGAEANNTFNFVNFTAMKTVVKSLRQPIPKVKVTAKQPCALPKTSTRQGSAPQKNVY